MWVNIKCNKNKNKGICIQYSGKCKTEISKKQGGKINFCGMCRGKDCGGKTHQEYVNSLAIIANQKKDKK